MRHRLIVASLYHYRSRCCIHSHHRILISIQSHLSELTDFERGEEERDNDQAGGGA